MVRLCLICRGDTVMSVLAIGDRALGALDSPLPTTVSGRRPWGFWSTLGWFVLAIGVSLVVGYIVLRSASSLPVVPSQPLLQWGGGLLIYLLIALVLAGAVRLAHWRLRDYFALILPRRRDVMVGLALIVAAIAIESALGFMFNIGKSDAELWIQTYRAAQAASALPLLWLAAVIAAPICEELAFRGFLFRGWAASRLGIVGTLVTTSVLFGLMHAGYSPIGIVAVIASGFLLGWLRWRSGTVTLPILGHMLYNMVAMSSLAVEITWAA